MDFSLLQIIKKEKEEYKEDFEYAADENPPHFYMDVCIQKQQTYDEMEWSYNALKTSFEETCTICGHIFKNRYLLLQHNVRHLNVTLQPLNIILSSPDEPNRKERKDIFKQCMSCNKILPYKTWISHIKEVHSHGSFDCDDCGRRFQCKRYIRNHIRNVHRENKHIKPKVIETKTCRLCSKVFMSNATLHCHMRNVHSNTAQQCEKCGSKLKSYPYYLTHLRRVHYDDGKEHKCNLCHKKFRSPRYLSIHKKNTHASNRKIKKFKIKKENYS